MFLRAGRRRGLAAARITAALLVAGGCAPTAPVLRETTLTGTWSGEHARLVLTAVGGTAEYDCAHGTVAGPLRTNGAGHFTAAGFHVREHGGPIRDGEVLDSVRAIYDGTAVGDQVTLRVVAGRDTLGPFVLRQGAPARLWKCL